MRATRWLIAALLGLPILGCGGSENAPNSITGPILSDGLVGAFLDARARQVLAQPAGSASRFSQRILNVVQSAGQMSGVAFDLGNELARSLGVPFWPVLYPSVGVLLNSGKTGAWDVAFVGFSPARAEERDFTGSHVEVEFGYLVPPPELAA